MVEVRLQIRPVSRGTYPLRSAHFEGLRIAMNRRGEWGHFDPHMTCDFESSTDMIAAFTVVAAPEILLPDWTHRSTADDAHAEAWDAMLAALSAHEDEHLRLFERAVQQFRRSMLRERPMPADRFRARWDAFCDDLQTAQDRYDRTTNNGEREGVRLDDPPSR
jgi:predicted secreted Zn-dependent protease